MDEKAEREFQALAEIVKDPTTDAGLKSRAMERMKLLDPSHASATAPVATEPARPKSFVDHTVMMAHADQTWATHKAGQVDGWPGVPGLVGIDDSAPHEWQNLPVDEVMRRGRFNPAKLAAWMARNPNAIAEHTKVS